MTWIVTALVVGGLLAAVAILVVLARANGPDEVLTIVDGRVGGAWCEESEYERYERLTYATRWADHGGR